MFFKKKSFLVLMLVLLASVALIVAGCGEEADVDDPEDDGEWPETLSLGTAGSGGVYYYYGSGWASVIEDNVDVGVNTEQTGGPGDNMFLVNARDNDLGMITMGIGYEGYYGEDGTAYEGQPQENVRALFPMYSTYSQWWAHADDEIESLSDLDGKSVGVGPTGGTPGTYHPLMLDAVGVDADPVHAALSDLVDNHMDGQIDANSFSSGIPVGGYLEYEANVGPEEVDLIPVEGEERDAIMEDMPFWSEAVIPEDTYDSIDEDIETVVVFNWAIGHKDLPDDLVYEIVDAVMSNHEDMVDAHDAAEETVPENIDTNDFLPLHPGAAEWFEENDYDIHDDAQPID
ncbi:TAXI family TRAP transporter solute-binding subunit [Natranaerofaba carboxydovora]|uniref:TAXI family TRAP transporter solute-binding subunit n=1 Tax=Natranaerofaba carboxydovora TaxID=2742683 RepID=UPI001F13C64E|nr:TAXI family TRAP transporter solute-binding subunit [Natranaerofaba carboxydovora]UMZ74186.1 NMT1-like family protein [Natranaerofaba carboxydovora]